jgi:hypothetical protein
MSTTVSIPTSRRTPLLAAAGALVATASVTLALVLGGGGGDTATSSPSVAPATASPDRATLYRSDAALRRVPAEGSGPSAAERFHHFR